MEGREVEGLGYGTVARAINLPRLHKVTMTVVLLELL